MGDTLSDQLKNFQHLLNHNVICTVRYEDGHSIQVNLGKIVDITDMGPAPGTDDGETD